MRAHLGTLKERNFRRFFLASFVSFFGSGLHLIAATWFVLEQTHSSAAVAAIWICQVLPSPLVLIFSGAVIDRLSRQRLLGILSFARAFIVLAIPLLIWGGRFSLWQLYAMTFLNGIGFNISFPAEKALVHEISRKDTLMSVNALIEMSIQIGVFLSAGASGLLYQRVGLAGVLAIDAATFLFAAAVFARMPASAADAIASRGQPYLEAVRDGWRYLFQDRALMLFACITFIPAAATLASNVVLPAYVREVIGQGVVSYGVLDMFYGVGAFLSGIAVLSLMKLGRARVVVGFILLSTAALALLPSVGIIWIAIALNLAFGFGNSSLRIVLSTILMEVAPKEYMGRISSASMLSSTVFQLASFAIVGYAVDRLSVGTGYGYLAALMLVTLGGYALACRRRATEERPLPAEGLTGGATPSPAFR